MDIGSVTSAQRPAALLDAVRAPHHPAPESAASDLPRVAVVAKSEEPVAVVDKQRSSLDGNSDLERRVIIDPDTQDIVFQSVDNATKSVVQQYPDKAILSRRAYIDKLEFHKSTTLDPNTHLQRIV